MDQTQVNFFIDEATVWRAPDWQSTSTEVYLNPRFPAALKDTLMTALGQAGQPAAQVIVTSSGTSGIPKVFAFSKKSFLAAAARVNERFESGASERWLCPLPLFHVGGLSIFARAHVARAPMPELLVFQEWSAQKFVQALTATGATATSLVPTQLYDLVARQLRAPEGLRCVFLGGDRLNEELYNAALELGWPVVPTYGMTETCGMIAAARSCEGSHFVFETLPKVRVAERNSCLEVACDSLPDAQLSFNVAIDALDTTQTRDNTAPTRDTKPLHGTAYWMPFSQEIFVSADRVEFCGPGRFKILGRQDRLVKVRGELVDPSYCLAGLSQRLGLDRVRLDFTVEADGRPVLQVHGELSEQECEHFLNKANQVVPPYLKFTRLECKNTIALANSAKIESWKK